MLETLVNPTLPRGVYIGAKCADEFTGVTMRLGTDDQQERLIEQIRILRDHTPGIRETGRRYGPDCMATCRGDGLRCHPLTERVSKVQAKFLVG